MSGDFIKDGTIQPFENQIDPLLLIAYFYKVDYVNTWLKQIQYLNFFKYFLRGLLLHTHIYMISKKYWDRSLFELTDWLSGSLKFFIA